MLYLNFFSTDNFAYILADACFKAALSIIQELPQTFEVDNKHKSSETFLIPYVRNFLSTLLVVPVSIFFLNFNLQINTYINCRIIQKMGCYI